MGKTYFCIRDVSHNGFIGAGSDHYDGFVYHYTDQNGKDECCQWFFEKAKNTGTSSPVYRIFNKKYKDVAIVAGDYQDGHVYLQKPNGRRNAEWFIEPQMFGKTKAFKITDSKHDKSICASVIADQSVHHYPVTDGQNGGWQLLVVSEGEDLIDYPFYSRIHISEQTPKVVNKKSKKVIITDLHNNTSKTKKCVHSDTCSVDIENKISTDKIVTKNTLIDVETNLGIKSEFIDLGVKTECKNETYDYDRTQTYHHVKTSEKTTYYLEYEVDPNQTVEGSVKISVDEILYDYSAEVHFQKLDGETIVKTIKGSYTIENNVNISYMYKQD